MKKISIVIFLLVTIIAGMVFSGCNNDETSEKLSELRLVGTIGPLSIPLAYMVDNNVMSSVAEKTTLQTWATPQQLQAIVAGGQADFVSLPTNAAATFYNKGIQLKLLDCSIWNILFVVSSDPDVHSITDLVGKRIVVPYQAGVPDAVFQYVLTMQGIDPEKDIDIYYAPDPVQASQLLISGEESYALLSEPSATSVIAKAASMGMTLYRNLDMNEEWQIASGGSSRSAIAGSIVLGDMVENEVVIKKFMAEYKKAVEWLLANPEEAGEMGARVLAEQGFTADVLTDSLKNIEWRYVPADEGYEDIQAFFVALMEISEDFTGGKLPDEAFYYGR